MGRAVAAICLLSYFLSFGAHAESLSADQVEKILQENPSIRSGEDLLSRLPDDFRTDPVLMYQSQSLQDASPTYPRAILFGAGHDDVGDSVKNDRLFLAFNGDPSQKNYSSFEMIQYRAAAGTFDFSKIVFSPGQAPVLLKSPPECVRCHDLPGHPNWTPYPFWPGAFPSQDGFEQSGDKEKGLYQSFYENQAKTGRYRFLHLKTTEELVPNDKPPTKRLSNILQDMAEGSLPRQIRASRNYAAYRYLIRAAFAQCSDLDSFIPDALRTRFAHTYAQVLAATTAEEKQSYVPGEIGVCANRYRLRYLRRRRYQLQLAGRSGDRRPALRPGARRGEHRALVLRLRYRTVGGHALVHGWHRR
jgi:hypothetical protein